MKRTVVFKTSKVTPAAIALLDSLENQDILAVLGLLRMYANARGLPVTPRHRMYTPAQLKIYRRDLEVVRNRRRREANRKGVGK